MAQWRLTFSLFMITFYIYHNALMLYFRLAYFNVLNSSLSLRSTLVISFYIDVILTFSNT